MTVPGHQRTRLQVSQDRPGVGTPADPAQPHRHGLDRWACPPRLPLRSAEPVPTGLEKRGDGIWGAPEAEGPARRSQQRSEHIARAETNQSREVSAPACGLGACSPVRILPAAPGGPPRCDGRAAGARHPPPRGRQRTPPRVRGRPGKQRAARHRQRLPHSRAGLARGPRASCLSGSASVGPWPERGWAPRTPAQRGGRRALLCRLAARGRAPPLSLQRASLGLFPGPAASQEGRAAVTPRGRGRALVERGCRGRRALFNLPQML